MPDITLKCKSLYAKYCRHMAEIAGDGLMKEAEFISAFSPPLSEMKLFETSDCGARGFRGSC